MREAAHRRPDEPPPRCAVGAPADAARPIDARFEGLFLLIAHQIDQVLAIVSIVALLFALIGAAKLLVDALNPTNREDLDESAPWLRQSGRAARIIQRDLPGRLRSGDHLTDTWMRESAQRPARTVAAGNLRF